MNRASDYHITDNIFDRSGYRMLHLVAKEAESLPEMSGNTYIQTVGGMLGQYGANCVSEPEILMYGDSTENDITDVLGDKKAKIYFV